MKYIFCVVILLQTCENNFAAIRSGRHFLNKLMKPVGVNIDKKFVALTEIPPPHKPHKPHSGRRHFDDCTQKYHGKEVYEGANVDIFGDYYDEGFAKTAATVIIPDHIDHKFFEITTQVPYLTLGTIDAIGYHPTTMKGEHPSECEKIYQDHLDEQYTDEETDYSEESMEMARMPLFPEGVLGTDLEEKFDKMYSDMDV